MTVSMMMPEMAAPLRRKVGGVSRAELERRWSLVRARLDARNADALVAVGVDNDLSGTIRWLTDAPVIYRRVVVLFRHAPMAVIEHGAAGRTRPVSQTDPDQPGVGEITTVSEFASVHYTQAYEAAVAIELLRRHGCRRVALTGGASMPFALRTALTAGLGDVEFIDETDFIDEAKALKSPEEMGLLRLGAALQDEVFAAVLPQLRPGMRDFEVSALAAYEARRRAGDHGILMCGSAPPGEPAFLRSVDQQGRVFGRGDAMTVLIENGSPDGLFLELGRNLSVGPASTEMLDAFALAREAQRATLDRLRPGVLCSEVFRAHNAFMTARGSAPEARLYAHGQGYDLIERPLIRDDEPMRLRAGMCIVVHPAAVTPRTFAFCCDNFLITEAEPERLHQTEQRVFEIEAP